MALTHSDDLGCVGQDKCTCPHAHLNSTTQSSASSSDSTTFVNAWLAPAVIMTSYCAARGVG